MLKENAAEHPYMILVFILKGRHFTGPLQCWSQQITGRVLLCGGAENWQKFCLPTVIIAIQSDELAWSIHIHAIEQPRVVICPGWCNDYLSSLLF